MRKNKDVLEWRGKKWLMAVVLGFGLSAYTHKGEWLLTIGPFVFIKG